VDDAARDSVPRKPQGKAGASYYSSISEDDFRLDWSADAEQLRRWICTSPGMCFSDIGRRRAFFLDAEVERRRAPGEPGTVIRVGRTCCAVATGNGVLRLRKVRLEPGREQFMKQLCDELGIHEGSRLE